MQTISKANFPNTRGLGRVLVVDDDASTAALLGTVGEREGYQVVSVSDGREAYRMLKSTADFTAAIFNMTMPNLNGIDIVRYMKTEKRLIRIPVIIVAGKNGLRLISDSFAAGALAFLPKPLTTERLAQTVRLAINSQALRTQSTEAGKIVADGGTLWRALAPKVILATLREDRLKTAQPFEEKLLIQTARPHRLW